MNLDYLYLKETIYDLSIEIKAEKVERTLSIEEGDIIKDYFGRLIV